MPQARRIQAQPLGTVFTEPGEDSDESPPAVPDIGVDPDDPAYPHVVRVLAEMLKLGFNVRDPEIIARAATVGRRREAAAQPLPPPPPPVTSWYPTARDKKSRAIYQEVQKPAAERVRVYYVRIGNRCKIGFTTNLWSRLVSLNPEELLAVEPGGRDVERQRHVEFRALRTNGEWFRFEGPLIEHTARLAEVPDCKAQVELLVSQWSSRRRGPDLRDGWRGGLRS